MEKDTFVLGGHEFTSRFILGSGKEVLILILLKRVYRIPRMNLNLQIRIPRLL